MWFKNLHLFHLLQPWQYDTDSLNAQLQTIPFVPCGELDLLSQGWVSPYPDERDTWIYEANRCVLLKMRKQEKILPSSVIREYIDEKVDEIEQREQRKVGRREKQTLRDEIVHTLLPRAFVRSNYLSAYVDTRHHWLLIDTPTRKKAEEFTMLLRKTLGSLPISPVQVQHSPSRVMTEWLQDNSSCPSDILLADACELTDTDLDGATVNCKRQDLLAEEIHGHLDAGKRVSRLSLEWADKIRCTLDDALVIKKLQLLDIEQQKSNIDGQDEMQQFDTDFVLMTDSIAAFLQRLFELFGGENMDAYAQAQHNLAIDEPVNAV